MNPISPRLSSIRVLRAVLLAIAAAAFAQAEPATSPLPAVVHPPAKEKFHIYLLMGQSNMAGRDTRQLALQKDNPHLLALNAGGQWAVARDPLHPRQGRIEPGAGPGIPFAAGMHEASPDITIGLVPCAVGGTSLKRWVKGADLYENAVKRARLAAPSGVIAGVLWHQGESDTTDQKSAETYEARLTKMLKDLRADLGAPDLPIVVGQLGGFLTKEKQPFAETVRAAIKHVPAVVPRVGYADSAGLGDKGDQLHFSADAQQEMGIRYAKAMQALRRTGSASVPQPSASAPPQSAVAVVDVWPDGRMPGKGANEPEAEKPSKDAFHRITHVSRPTLTVFPAPKKDAPAPAMTVCPGGGYSYVVIDKEGSEIAGWLNSLGITAVVLKYRVPNNRAGALQDVQRALSLTRAKAAGWGIDPKRVGVIGFSAGGNLSAKASTLFEQRSYPALDDIDRQSCRPDCAVLVYPAYLDNRQGGISPDLNLKADIPPTLIVHSEDDKTFVPGSKLYHAALDDAKVPHDFLLYQTGGHGYGMHCTREAKAWPEAAAKWLEKNGMR